MALVKASVGSGGCGCGGAPAGVAVGLGLDLGQKAMPCTNPAYAPRFAASGLRSPKSSNADQVGDQTQAFPSQSSHREPTPCQQWATNRHRVPPPPPFSARG